MQFVIQIRLYAKNCDISQTAFIVVKYIIYTRSLKEYIHLFRMHIVINIFHNLKFYIVPVKLNGVMLAGSMYVLSSILPSLNVLLCNANKRLHLEAPISAHICMVTICFHLPFFVQIVNDFELHFKVWDLNQHWEVHMWLYRKWRQIGRTLLLPTNIKTSMTFWLAYLHLTLGHTKDQGQAYFDWEYLANSDR